MGWFQKKKKSKTLEEIAFDSKYFEGLELCNKGNNYYLNRQDDEAINCFNEAINCGYESASLYSSLGSCHQTKTNHVEAIACFDKAILLSPKDCNIYFMRAISKDSIKNFKDAIIDFQSAIDLSLINSSLNSTYNKGAIAQGYSSLSSMYKSFMDITKVQDEFHKYTK